ncbi:MAG TPA: cupredoxin domain-containing protein [Vicinamibacterales bacterium]|nr:cupredoxin domain-containing protein [Vicinamibacterales bacterium]
MAPRHGRHGTLVRVVSAASAIAWLAVASALITAQDRAPNRRDVTLVAREHQFIPDRIDVRQDDLVRITFTSEGRPASFAVDAYRIIKRVGADRTIVFEFRADQAGTFTFYCSLTSDPQCRDMKGTLVVAPK